MASSTVALEGNVKQIWNAVSSTLTVATGEAIPKGTLVGIDGSGNATDVSTSARIAGVAVSSADAAETVTVYSNIEVKLIHASAAATLLNTTVYASDNQTATSTPNTAILGRVTDWESGYVWVLLTLRA
jgi:hypothetical protein